MEAGRAADSAADSAAVATVAATAAAATAAEATVEEAMAAPTVAYNQTRTVMEGNMVCKWRARAVASAHSCCTKILADVWMNSESLVGGLPSS